jgi:hypothetical protein
MLRLLDDLSLLACQPLSGANEQRTAGGIAAIVTAAACRAKQNAQASQPERIHYSIFPAKAKALL